MRIVLISDDLELITMLKETEYNSSRQLSIIQSNPEPLEIISAIINMTISILILDDDFVKPQSAAIIRTIKKVANDAAVIFITSDASIELGSEISQLGIQFYALKPITQDTLFESINFIGNKQLKTIN